MQIIEFNKIKRKKKHNKKARIANCFGQLNRLDIKKKELLFQFFDKTITKQMLLNVLKMHIKTKNRMSILKTLTIFIAIYSIFCR